MAPTTIVLILLLILILCIVIFSFFRLEKKTSTSSELVEWIKEVSRRLETNSQAVDRKLEANLSMFNNRLDSTAAIISQVQKSIGEFSEIGRSMQDLQQYLQSPKLRGNIGEQILRDVLAQHFPPKSFSLQHSFGNGETVDALILTANGTIPIDAKFPMENFRRYMDESDQTLKEGYKRDFEKDVKKHIASISKKYILPDEGTCDYALMYIPSESIYYEIINSSDLFDYSGTHKVLPVSPISFYAYMKAILMSLEGKQIETRAKEILTLLQAIKKDYEKLDGALTTLTSHINHAYNQTTQVNKSLTTLGQKLSATRLLSEETHKADNKDENLLEE